MSGILRVKVSLVLLEERGVPVALSDGGSAGREVGHSLRDAGLFFGNRNIILSRRRKRQRMFVWIVCMNTRRKLGLHAQTLAPKIQPPAELFGM
jgi:hypothetical protein